MFVLRKERGSIGKKLQQVEFAQVYDHLFFGSSCLKWDILDILCPSLETSCVAKDNSNIIKQEQGNIFSYAECGGNKKHNSRNVWFYKFISEKCKQNEDCKYWTFNTTGTSIPVCYLLKNCFKSENELLNTISGNNLCPLPGSKDSKEFTKFSRNNNFQSPSHVQLMDSVALKATRQM